MVFSNTLASLATLDLVVAVFVVVVIFPIVVVVIASKVVSVFILIVVASPSVVVFPRGFELEGPASLVHRPLPIVVIVVQKYVVVPLKVFSCYRDLPSIGCRLVEIEGLFGAAPSFVAKLLSAFGNGCVSSR